MAEKSAVSLVLNAHFPFVREHAAPRRRDSQEGDPQPPPKGADPGLESAEECLFFGEISETYLPLLEALDRLEADGVPFKLGLSISPLLGQMLGDARLMKRYAAHLDRRISFGAREAARLGGAGPQALLAERYLDRAVDLRAAFSARYEGSVLGALGHYRRRGKIEMLAAPATDAFLPFLCQFPESVQAQIEVGLSFSRRALEAFPRGFWLPGLGWAEGLDAHLRAYGFGFTIVDSHGLVFGEPAPSRGSFFPVRTPQGLFALARDFNAAGDLDKMRGEGPYRDNGRDVGHDLPPELISPFIARNGARCHTGYKYWRQQPAEGAGDVYDPDEAMRAAREHARAFLENRRSQLAQAAGLMKERPISVCAFDSGAFGSGWHEGAHFIESLFRLARDCHDVEFMTPSEYLGGLEACAAEKSLPAFSSWGENGYAERWLDSSNDWIYRHLGRACERMVELAERFPGDSWVRERALNQAARELLLAQSSDWPAMMRRRESAEFARSRAEGSLRNFTAIYEAMSSNRISTEWLTDLESSRGVFPDINYRVFRRKT